MPRVEIKLFEGRTLDQKRAMVKGVTEVIAETCKVPKERVSIVLHEMKTTELARGGILKCDE